MGDGCNVVFADTHTRFVRQHELKDLRWTAQQNE
jgi:prepilin-type processing-associated H-X9-DG protein